MAQQCSTSSSDAKYCSMHAMSGSQDTVGTVWITPKGGGEADEVADYALDVDVCGGEGRYRSDDLVELAPELGGRVELVVDTFHCCGAF